MDASESYCLSSGPVHLLLILPESLSFHSSRRGGCCFTPMLEPNWSLLILGKRTDDVSSALIEHHDQNNSGRKEFILLAVPYHNPSAAEVREGTEAAREPRSRNWSRSNGGALLTSLLSMVSAAGSPTAAVVTSPGVELPSHLGFSCQSPIKETPQVWS